MTTHPQRLLPFFGLLLAAAAGSDDYKILISKSGIGPTNYGVDIPLTQDSLVTDTFLGNYPVPTTNNMHGTLDANGQASANLPGQLPAYSSAPTTLTITP
jgi:hypothetical protein